MNQEDCVMVHICGICGKRLSHTFVDGREYVTHKNKNDAEDCRLLLNRITRE